MIERLAFDEDGRFNAVEAASHLARYSVARPFCSGRRVLDIACGQGYGSYLLHKWGATRVDGVDIAPEAIAAARHYFASPDVHYHEAAAEGLMELFEPGAFDLIVCLETIEHVADAEKLLRLLSQQLRPGGTVIVSCPNDYWYYPTPSEGNPYHRRKFRFGEFRALFDKVLAGPKAYYYGTPLSGFVTLPMNDANLIPGGGEDSLKVITRAAALPGAAMLPADEVISDANCSYFVAVCGPDAGAGSEPACVLFPCSMNASFRAVESLAVRNLRDEVRSLRQRLYDTEAGLTTAPMQAELATVQAELLTEREQSGDTRRTLAGLRTQFSAMQTDYRATGLRLAATQAENQYLREEAAAARGQVAEAAERAKRAEAETEALRAALFERPALDPEQAAQIADWQRRIENLDRMKRWIPSPIWSLLRMARKR